MGRIFKYILILSILIGLLGYSYFKSKMRFKSMKISKNSVVVNDFEMSKTVSDDEYYIIKAARAKYSKDMNSVVLDNCTVTYEKRKNILQFRSDICEYQIDKKVILKGNVKGHYNEIKFESADNVSCEYDLKKGVAELNGEVAFKRNENYIKADRVFFDNKRNVVVFEENVEVVYEMGSN